MRLHSDAGRLLNHVLDLEFSIEKFKMDWSDVTAEEVKALQILTEERQKHQQEEREKDDQDRAMKQALNR